MRFRTREVAALELSCHSVWSNDAKNAMGTRVLSARYTLVFRFVQHLLRNDSLECPPRLSRELKVVFPKMDVRSIRVIPTCQNAQIDLTNWGDEVEAEKSALLQKARFSSIDSDLLLNVVFSSAAGQKSSAGD